MLTSEYDPSPDEILGILLRRKPVVEFLADRPRSKQELREELDLPKSTMYKVIRELEELGLAERVGDEYQLTQFGQVVRREFRSMYQSLERMCTGVELLLSVSPDLGVHPAIFSDADLYMVKPEAPDRPINKFEELIRESDHLRGFAPVTRARYIEMFYDLFDDDAIEAEIIIDTTVYDYVMENFHDEFKAEVEAEVSNFRLLDDEFPFGLSILDGSESSVVVNFYDMNHNLLGIVVSQNEKARRWAIDVFKTYRERSEVIDSSEL